MEGRQMGGYINHFHVVALDFASTRGNVYLAAWIHALRPKRIEGNPGHANFETLVSQLAHPLSPNPLPSPPCPGGERRAGFRVEAEGRAYGKRSSFKPGLRESTR